jgi:hypothetical protein
MKLNQLVKDGKRYSDVSSFENEKSDQLMHSESDVGPRN